MKPSFDRWGCACKILSRSVQVLDKILFYFWSVFGLFSGIFCSSMVHGSANLEEMSIEVFEETPFNIWEVEKYVWLQNHNGILKKRRKFYLHMLNESWDEEGKEGWIQILYGNKEMLFLSFFYHESVYYQKRRNDLLWRNKGALCFPHNSEGWDILKFVTECR